MSQSALKPNQLTHTMYSGSAGTWTLDFPNFGPLQSQAQMDDFIYSFIQVPTCPATKRPPNIRNGDLRAFLGNLCYWTCPQLLQRFLPPTKNHWRFSGEEWRPIYLHLSQRHAGHIHTGSWCTLGIQGHLCRWTRADIWGTTAGGILESITRSGRIAVQVHEWHCIQRENASN